MQIAAALLVFAGIALLTVWLLEVFPSYRPFIAWLARLNSGLPLGPYRRFYETRLLFPGQEGAPGFGEFLAVKELLAIGGCAVFGFLLDLPAMFSFPAAVIFFLLPDIRFSDRLKRRREFLRRTFIPFLDLMTLILESGVDFMGSLNFLRGRFPAGDLTREIDRMLMEIELGGTREKALTHFAGRTGDRDIGDFVSAVIASEKSGGSLAKVLKNLSATVKTARIQRAEKAAHEAPVKLLGPLVLFIFPVVFIILFGPIIIGFIQ